MILVKWSVVSLDALLWHDHGVWLPGNDRVLGCLLWLAALVLSTLLPIHPGHISPSILWVISLVIATHSGLGLQGSAHG